jgi:hypothetical protein
MPGRYEGLKATIEGYARTGIELIAYNDPIDLGHENAIGPAGITDNLGSYYFIPKFVQVSGISLDVAIQIFYTGFTFISYLVATIFTYKLLKTKVGKYISIIALALVSFIIAGIGDYYVYYGAIPLMLIPAWLYVYKSQNKLNIIVYILFAGIIISLGHLMRSHSGTDVMIILFIMIIASKMFDYRKKLLLVMIFSIIFFLVIILFKQKVDQRYEYLKSIETRYTLSSERIIFHNIYYSLGYLNNFYGDNGYKDHEPSDTYSSMKALSVNPEVQLFSQEYEKILRNETIKFIVDHPFFFINTIFAKLGVLLMYVLIFANIGLVLAIYYPQGYQFNLLFAVGIGFNMLFGLLATPDYQYLTGLFAFATLYGLFSIDYAVDNGLFKKFYKIGSH